MHWACFIRAFGRRRWDSDSPGPHAALPEPLGRAGVRPFRTGDRCRRHCGRNRNAKVEEHLNSQELGEGRHGSEISTFQIDTCFREHVCGVGPLSPHVILSAVAASRSEAATKSKDPYSAKRHLRRGGEFSRCCRRRENTSRRLEVCGLSRDPSTMREVRPADFPLRSG